MFPDSSIMSVVFLMYIDRSLFLNEEEIFDVSQFVDSTYNDVLPLKILPTSIRNFIITCCCSKQFFCLLSSFTSKKGILSFLMGYQQVVQCEKFITAPLQVLYKIYCCLKEGVEEKRDRCRVVITCCKWGIFCVVLVFRIFYVFCKRKGCMKVIHGFILRYF